MVRKSKLMRRVEERFGQPLESLIPTMFNELGLSDTAAAFGVSRATLGYWMLKLGINVRRLALQPGEYVEIDRSTATSGRPEVVYASKG